MKNRKNKVEALEFFHGFCHGVGLDHLADAFDGTNSQSPHYKAGLEVGKAALSLKIAAFELLVDLEDTDAEKFETDKQLDDAWRAFHELIRKGF